MKNIKLDIHDYDLSIKSVVKRIKNHEKISEKNKKTILKFYDHCAAEGLSKARMEYYLNRLSLLAQWIKKDFEKANKNDVKSVMRKVNEMPYTEWTKKDYRVTLKKFYKWLRKIDEKGVYPEEVSWITTTAKKDKQDLPCDLLTEEDISKMIGAAEHPRDKALISMLYESGCRVGEISSLRIGDVKFDDYGIVIIVGGKTGQRRLRLVASVPYLSGWLNIHPEKNNPQAPLWVVIGTSKNIHKSSKKYKLNWSYNLKYRAVSNMIKNAAKKAGIKKNVYPHLFRHSRATYLADKLTEAQLKVIFGWRQSSKMPGVYVHLSGRDVDDAVLNLYGKKKIEPKDQESKLKPIDCPRCKELNEPHNIYCKKCGWILDRKASIELERKRKECEEIAKELVEDPESLRELAKALGRLGLVKKLMKI